MTYSSDGLDLLYRYGPSSQLLESFTYNSSHQITSATRYADAQTGYTIGLGYDTYGRVTSTTSAANMIVNYAYGSDGYLSTATNQTTGAYEVWTWQNGMIRSYQDPRGLVVTNSWDFLKRPTRVDYPDGTYQQYIYGMPGGLTFPYGTGGTNILDLTASRDRLGNWKYYRYNGIRQRIAETNELNKVTLYDYCNCGSPSVITDALGQPTTFFYDYLGQKTGVVNSDALWETYIYNSMGQLIMRYDRLGTNTYGYNNQGLQTVVSNAFGLEQSIQYDILDLATNVVNASGVSVNQTFDYLGRLLSRSYPDNNVERFVNNDRGVIYYTNQLLKLTQYAYDAAGRKTNEINPNNETIKYTYNPAGDLLTLKDGKNQQTFWHYDTYGRVYAKRDTTGSTNFIYAYNANGWLTNRWTPAKLNTRRARTSRWPMTP
jgi:YD repeat-containing protein